MLYYKRAALWFITASGSIVYIALEFCIFKISDLLYLQKCNKGNCHVFSFIIFLVSSIRTRIRSNEEKLMKHIFIILKLLLLSFIILYFYYRLLLYVILYFSLLLFKIIFFIQIIGQSFFTIIIFSYFRKKKHLL